MHQSINQSINQSKFGMVYRHDFSTAVGPSGGCILTLPGGGAGGGVNWASIKLLQDDHSSAFVGKDCGDCCPSLRVAFCLLLLLLLLLLLRRRRRCHLR